MTSRSRMCPTLVLCSVSGSFRMVGDTAVFHAVALMARAWWWRRCLSVHFVCTSFRVSGVAVSLDLSGGATLELGTTADLGLRPRTDAMFKNIFKKSKKKNSWATLLLTRTKTSAKISSLNQGLRCMGVWEISTNSAWLCDVAILLQARLYTQNDWKMHETQQNDESAKIHPETKLRSLSAAGGPTLWKKVSNMGGCVWATV